jgi:hypothetical protein
MEKKQANKSDHRISPESNDQPNRNQQGVDKAPGEERGRGEKLTSKDLKGKKVDADPSQQKDRPD